MKTYKNIQRLIYKHLRPNVAFLLAPEMIGCIPPPPHFFSKDVTLVGRQTHVPSCQFNEESTLYLAPKMLSKWRH